MSGKRNLQLKLLRGCFILFIVCFLIGIYEGIVLLRSYDASESLGTSKNVVHKASDIIKVFIKTESSRLSGSIATMNSVLRNTKSPVHFYFIVENTATASKLLNWINKSTLSLSSFNIKVFNSENFPSALKDQLQNQFEKFIKLYIEVLFNDLSGRIVCLDDDIILQGDIKDLANVKFQKGHIGAASFDCDVVSKRFSHSGNLYGNFMNVQNEKLREKNINESACIFNMGVMVINLTQWKQAKILDQLQHWTVVNKKENIFMADSLFAPVLIALYDKLTPLDPSWHIRHLGITAGSRYSRKFLTQAKLVHWDGNFKPWLKKSPHRDIWLKYAISEPK